MFHFLYYTKDGDDEESNIPRVSKFFDLNVQLFTSDILAAHAVDARTEQYVTEYFFKKNSLGSDGASSKPAA